MAGLTTHRIDIREIKKGLRADMKRIRREMPPELQAKKDAAILTRLTALPEYQNASLVLTYVSTEIEVNTIRLIEQAWADGKRVAVPYCIPGKIDMAFYEIHSLSDLSPGSFGVLEPDPEKQEMLTDFPDSAWFCFDFYG